jgi:hypothetical protein
MVAIDNEERTDDNFKYREPYPMFNHINFTIIYLYCHKTLVSPVIIICSIILILQLYT